MGLMANRLRRERTTASAKRPTITMNAPGVYIPRYGKMKVFISGRGESGNNSQPGNIAYYNPNSGGNVYYNSDRMYGSSYTVFTHVGGTKAYSYNDHPWGPSSSKPSGYSYNANPSTHPGYSVVNFNISGYNPGNRGYNPEVPGNAVYNPRRPAAAGSPTNILGVVFPGGGVGALAQTISDTRVDVPYAGATVGVTITVPPGGSIVIKEI